MSNITIIEKDTDTDIWIGLEDSDPPDGLCFIIGTGRDRETAIAEAVADLDAALVMLRKAKQQK